MVGSSRSPGFAGALFPRAIRLFDALLRRLLKIQDPPAPSFFRYRLRAASRTLLLGKEVVEKGAPVLEIHLFNERIPPIPTGKPSVAWGGRMGRLVREGFSALARESATDPHLARARAVGGPIGAALSPLRGPGVRRLMEHLGFHVVVVPPSPLERLWAAGDAVHSALLYRGYQPAGDRPRGILRLPRAELWMTMAELRARYGRPGSAPGRDLEESGPGSRAEQPVRPHVEGLAPPDDPPADERPDPDRGAEEVAEREEGERPEGHCVAGQTGDGERRRPPDHQ